MPRDAQWKAVVVGFSCGIVINPCVVPVRKAKKRVNVEQTQKKQTVGMRKICSDDEKFIK